MVAELKEHFEPQSKQNLYLVECHVVVRGMGRLRRGSEDSVGQAISCAKR